ncbi:PemI-like protein [Xenorhabdus mauleonii]|uniref:Antitoxin component of the MazEF toxin-antitoxin module n=1 Tax=Xenorhabdus mauleonii TaxID=351675 RepID=A0A1I3SIZ8_9GAMM|nr:AbrB/MazE/SpoVT family DNA-binding domain-containing protein [Xenorhabdus mauleonii]PHM39202.1 PemI-like protein [Xenorhabdus mauleonii]SFJ58643.1 Antitoxin component of the MazEF toxin-antitoxin module [Xenorhabdus mauleonii]
MTIAIKKWGNSQGIIIPTNILNQIGLRIGGALDMKVDSGRIILTPRKERKIFSEADLLAGLNEYNAHADELAVITSAELGE